MQQPRLLVRHLQEEREGQLLDLVAIRQAVIAQDAAVVPELADKSGGIGCHVNQCSIGLTTGEESLSSLTSRFVTAVAEYASATRTNPAKESIKALVN